MRVAGSADDLERTTVLAMLIALLAALTLLPRLILMTRPFG